MNKLLVIGLLVLTKCIFSIEVVEIDNLSNYKIENYYWLDNNRIVIDFLQDGQAELGIYDITDKSLQVVTSDLNVTKKSLSINALNSTSKVIQDKFIFFQYGIVERDSYVYSVKDDIIYDLKKKNDKNNLIKREDYSISYFESFSGFKGSGRNKSKIWTVKIKNLIENTSDKIKAFTINDLPKGISPSRNYKNLQFDSKSNKVYFNDSSFTKYYSGEYLDGVISNINEISSNPKANLAPGKSAYVLDHKYIIAYKLRFTQLEYYIYSPMIFNFDGEILFSLDDYVHIGESQIEVSPNGKFMAVITDKASEIKINNDEMLSGTYKPIAVNSLFIFEISHDE